MDVGETLEVASAKAWRAWLRKNHARRREVWLVFYRKGAGKAGISYNDAVDEALCFGWIDSIVKRLDADRRAQRFTPRRPGSKVSSTNLARVRRLVAEGRMTQGGLNAIGGLPPTLRVHLASDIRDALKADPRAWRNYQRFPRAYRAIRIGWIELARGRPDEFRKRLDHFVKMTREKRQFGMVRG